MGYLKVYLSDVDVVSLLIKNIPEIDIQTNPLFKTSKHKNEKSRYLASLLLRSFNKQSLHKNPGYGDSSFASRDLINTLGRNYKEYLDPLYHFLHENMGYSKKAHLTKSYTLKSQIRRRVRDAIRNYDGTERIVDKKGIQVTQRKLDGNGNQCKSSQIKLPGVVNVDIQKVNETIDTLATIETAEKKTGNMAPVVSGYIDELCYLRRWVRATGGIPNFYREESTGRLGRLGEFHITQASNIVRMLLFRGSGLVDFDFANCHLALFRSLCAYHGFDTPYVEEYMHDRKRIAKEFQSNFNISPADTKQVFLSFLFGSPLVPHSTTTNTALLGYNLAKALSEDPWAVGLKKEILGGGDAILSEHPRTRKHTKLVTRNIVGKETTAKNKGSRLSHVLTGYERWCLETVCRDFDDTQCLIYDGWISPDRDVSELENRILERSITELGFPIDMRIKRKPISDSVDDILGK